MPSKPQRFARDEDRMMRKRGSKASPQSNKSGEHEYGPPPQTWDARLLGCYSLLATSYSVLRTSRILVSPGHYYAPDGLPLFCIGAISPSALVTGRHHRICCCRWSAGPRQAAEAVELSALCISAAADARRRRSLSITPPPRRPSGPARPREAQLPRPCHGDAAAAGCGDSCARGAAREDESDGSALPATDTSALAARPPARRRRRGPGWLEILRQSQPSPVAHVAHRLATTETTLTRTVDAGKCAKVGSQAFFGTVSCSSSVPGGGATDCAGVDLVACGFFLCQQYRPTLPGVHLVLCAPSLPRSHPRWVYQHRGGLGIRAIPRPVPLLKTTTTTTTTSQSRAVTRHPADSAHFPSAQPSITSHTHQ